MNHFRHLPRLLPPKFRRVSPFLPLLVVVLAFNRCIDPIDFERARDGSFLVVDGRITNGEGPSTCRSSCSRYSPLTLRS